MKTNNGKWAGYLVALGVVAGVSAGAAAPGTVEQNFSYTTAFLASPLEALPTINEIWNIQSYAGLPADLVGVKLEMTTQLRYMGTLESLLPNKAYTVQVRSDFNLAFPGPTPSQTALDPVVILSGTAPSTAWTPFDIAGDKALSATQMLLTPTELNQYRSGSPVPVFVTGNLRTDPLSGYHNTSDLGSASPAVFVDTPKVLPLFGAQFYELQATLTVTYFVPEAPTPVVALAGLGLGWYLLRRRRKAQ